MVVEIRSRASHLRGAGFSGYGPGVGDDASSWERLRLSTGRLCLRTPTPADAEALYDLFADAEVMRGLGKEPVSALEEARAMIDGGIWRVENRRVGPMRLGPSSGSSP